MIKIAIVEDENNAAATLAEFINRYCSANNISVDIVRYNSAVELLKNYTPVYDIIFMDIMMPDLNGIDAAKELRTFDDTVTLIFVTNMANFAVKGYEVAALDFIIKPLVYDSFAMKMNRALNAVKRHRSVDVKISVDRTIRLISASKIYYVEISGHNLIFHTQEGDIKTRGTLDGIEKQLAGQNFARCNVCYLVNLKYITEVVGDNVIMADTSLKISRARKKDFLQTLTNFLGKIV